jgi:hypothetical protein
VGGWGEQMKQGDVSVEQHINEVCCIDKAVLQVYHPFRRFVQNK